MNLWSWVWGVTSDLRKNNETELVRQVSNISSDTCAGRHKQVDLYAKQAIQRARKLKLSWLEVFLRHWHLQSLVLHRANPKMGIKEAVSLLEFSSREDTKDCPQSICVVQDLTNCYACFDGVGYAKERLAVADETMNRIDPSWDCYLCIATEYASALFDLGDYKECSDYINKINKNRMLVGFGQDTHELCLIQVHILIMEKKYKKARTLIKKVSRRDATLTVRKNIHKALIEASAGKYKQAMEILPTLAETKKSPITLFLWAEVLYLCILGDPSFNNKRNINKLVKIVNDMEERGVYRDSFNLLAWLVKLSQDPQNDLKGTELLARMENIKTHLKRDCGAEDKLQALISNFNHILP